MTQKVTEQNRKKKEALEANILLCKIYLNTKIFDISIFVNEIQLF